MKFVSRLCVCAAASALSSGVAFAEISDADCRSMKTMIENLANQNLALAEFKKELALRSMQKLVDSQSSAEAAIEHRVMSEVLDALAEIEVDAKDLVPGIIAYRGNCE